jgi:uncharacterized membrane protein YjgN (DUF898 family)
VTVYNAQQPYQPGASPAPPAARFYHTGRLANVLGLAAKNALVSILTLTLYRFWARTSMRRRIWSRVWILGDSLEYTGTGWELFRGFLISLPCFFLPAIFVFYIAPYAINRTAASLLILAFYVASVPLVAAARYWMRRYQLSRTRWRGIRLGLVGSGWSFAWASSGWTLIQGLTLGWFTPVARMNRAKMIWENTRFGDQPFSFAQGETELARGLWGPFALGWFAAPIATFGGFIITGLIAATFFGFTGGGAPVGAQANSALALIGVAVVIGALIVGLILFVLLWAPYEAAAMNRIAALIELDGARFHLRATTMGLFGVTLAGWLILIFSLGLLAPVAGLLKVRYVFNRLEMLSAPRFAEIGQSVIEGPRAGESMADAFDLDLGVGLI